MNVPLVHPFVTHESSQRKSRRIRFLLQWTAIGTLDSLLQILTAFLAYARIRRNRSRSLTTTMMIRWRIDCSKHLGGQQSLSLRRNRSWAAQSSCTHNMLASKNRDNRCAKKSNHNGAPLAAPAGPVPRSIAKGMSRVIQRCRETS